jgi:hypothetical protein
MTRKDPITRRRADESTSLQQEPRCAVERDYLRNGWVACIACVCVRCDGMRRDILVMHKRGVANVKVRYGNRRPLWWVCPALPPRAAS